MELINDLNALKQTLSFGQDYKQKYLDLLRTIVVATESTSQVEGLVADHVNALIRSLKEKDLTIEKLRAQIESLSVSDKDGEVSRLVEDNLKLERERDHYKATLEGIREDLEPFGQIMTSLSNTLSSNGN